MNHIRTQAVHAGQQPDPVTGALATGIAQTTAFAYGSTELGAAIFAGQAQGWTYSRTGNPTVAALEAKMAALEGGEAAVAFTTGMAAMSAAVLSWLKAGDEVLSLGPLYGGADAYLRDLSQRLGIRWIAMTSGDIGAQLTPATRLIWIETPTNPTLQLHDLAAVAAVARARGITTVVDNTFATPCLTRPIELGIDVVMHSMTKYLGGHGDATGGVLVGPRQLMSTVRDIGLHHHGGSLAPHTAFLFLRGLKTLPLRMAAHCEGAARVALFLKEHPLVARVHYPGLPEHPQHALAQRQMTGGFGGVVSFELAQPGRAAAAAFLDGLHIFVQAVSLGDVCSLACHPASTTHSFIPPEARLAQGINDQLIRLSVGIEHPDDLIADLRSALNP